MRRRAVIIAMLVACMVGSSLVLAALIAADPHEVDVEYLGEARSIPRAARRTVQETADAAFHDARLALPELPERLSLVVQFGSSVIPETGDNGGAVPPAEIAWTVDPKRDLMWMIRTQLRATLFHELHHLARAASAPTLSLMDRVVTEGMATAFERDFARVDPPWGKAPPEVMDWTRELLLQPAGASQEEWLIRHPDGRRWIGMRAGTFLVDRAAKASGRSSARLVSASTEEILALAQVR